ncbi:MAG: RimK family alpha-L-glutamate ligase, partial [Deltaproteobacteria bacterium]|nr:RimK family alpha-L-glutamate ligase [Deltaproteobacteria bacterium]
PPSDKKALHCFVQAFKKVGIKAEFIEAKERPNIGEYDALFIRETTHVNHHTFKLASTAEKEGLFVIDDPNSILKCTNKIFLEQLMGRIGVKRPTTKIMDKRIFEEEMHTFVYPCIVKKPDSAFSQGVYKAQNIDELKKYAQELFTSTELILTQEYLPTNYDWRVGVLNGQVIYCCKYYMAKGHWQIINNSGSKAEEGDFECIDPKQVDKKVLDVALKATHDIGTGLYGVDLKQSGEDVYLIEVNDNPSIDFGVEDMLLGSDLYMLIAKHFLHQCNKKRGLNV